MNGQISMKVKKNELLKAKTVFKKRLVSCVVIVLILGLLFPVIEKITGDIHELLVLVIMAITLGVLVGVFDFLIGDSQSK